MREPLYLDEEQVRQHLRMENLIPAMAKALIDFSAGKVTQPVRSVIPVDPPGGFFGMMPALTADGLGIKIVTFYATNVERGIPTHMATMTRRFSRFSEAACKRAVTWKRYDWSGILRKFVCGVARRRMRSGSRTKLARKRWRLNSLHAMPMLS